MFAVSAKRSHWELTLSSLSVFHGYEIKSNMVKWLFAAGIAFTTFHSRNQQNTRFFKPLNKYSNTEECEYERIGEEWAIKSSMKETYVKIEWQMQYRKYVI